MADTSDNPARRRAHAERMLARAQRRSRLAAALVAKWKKRLADLDREGVVARQSRLWTEEQPEQEGEAERPGL